MRNFLRAVGCGILAAGMSAFYPYSAHADDRDSNADATFHSVSDSTGVLLRVPIDAHGDEDTNAAELRVLTIEPGRAVTADSLPHEWANARTMDLNTAAPGDSSVDSSTSWWGWNNWCGYGWRSPYHYYYNYTPSFNYYGDHYRYAGYSHPNYSYPSYYNSYRPHGNYYGYRYYHYPRYYY